MKILSLFFLFALWLIPQEMLCQSGKQKQLDSLYQKFVKDSSRIYRHHEVSFLFALDTRNTFIREGNKVPVDLKGAQVGMVIGEQHSIGLGFYSLLSTQQKRVSASDNSGKTYNVNLNMGYMTLFYQYLLLDRKHIEIGVPLEIGVGDYHTTETDSLGKSVPGFTDTLKRQIVLFGGGLSIDFKLKWIGFNIMGGYRLVGGSQPNHVNFNGFFYSYGLQIYFGEILKSFKLHERRGSYIYNVNRINNETP